MRQCARASTASPAPPARRRRVSGLLVAALLVLAAVNAATFAAHAGARHAEAASPPWQHVAMALEAGPLDAGAEVTEPGPHALQGDSSHVMHGVGACLAVLLLAGLWALARPRRLRWPWAAEHAAPDGRPSTILDVAVWRGPPTPSPPTSSPVLRA